MEEVWYDPVGQLPAAEIRTQPIVREARPVRFDYHPESVVLYSQPADTWSYNVVVQDNQGISAAVQTIVQPALGTKNNVPSEKPTLRLPRQHRRRFTWESPEMYVEDSDDELG